MSAIAPAPEVSIQYACTMCTHPPSVNQRGVAIHLVRRHGVKGSEERAGKAVAVEVPLSEANRPGPVYPTLHAVERYHVSALRLPTAQVLALDNIIKERGKGNRAELVREAVQFYLGASDADTWQERYAVEHRRRLVAEETLRRIRVGLQGVEERLATLRRS